MKIKLHLLRQAQALTAHGSFSRAAAALSLSQPALSQGIKELEDQVGLQLFVRNRSGPELTDFGRLFMQHAAELIAGAADLEREVALAKGLATGELSVGAGPYAMEALAPACVPAFAAAHPGVRLRIVTDSPSALARLVRTRSIDLGVAEASVLENDDNLEVVCKLEPLRGYVIVRARHPLTAKAPVSLANVLEYPFVQVVMLPPRVLKPFSRRGARQHRAPGRHGSRRCRPSNARHFVWRPTSWRIRTRSPLRRSEWCVRNSSEARSCPCSTNHGCTTNGPSSACVDGPCRLR